MKTILITFLLLIAYCGTESVSNKTLNSAECALSYDTNEALFSEEDTLIFGINVIYFMNGDTSEYTREWLDKKFNDVSFLFKDARIKFKVLTFSNLRGVPSDHFQFNESVKEKLTVFNIENYQFFGMMMNQPHVINVYVYHEPKITQFAGVAGGIGSDYLAIRKDYFDVPTRTLPHELGHCLSLYHPHQPDDTDGYNIFSGDRVCDTPAGRSLSGRVNRECDLIGPATYADSIHKNLIMSYAYPFCRDSFSPNQIKKMRWYVEQSPQAQSLLLNRHELMQRKLEDTWINLK